MLHDLGGLEKRTRNRQVDRKTWCNVKRRLTEIRLKNKFNVNHEVICLRSPGDIIIHHGLLTMMLCFFVTPTRFLNARFSSSLVDVDI